MDWFLNLINDIVPNINDIPKPSLGGISNFFHSAFNFLFNYVDRREVDETMNAFQHQISDLKNELKEKNQLITNEQSHVNRLQKNLENLENYKETTTKKITDSEIEIKSLKKEIEEKKENLITHEQNHINRLQKSLENLENYKETTTKKITDSEIEIKSLKKEIEEKNKSLENERYESLNLIEEKNKIIEEKENLITHTQGYISRLEKSLENLDENLKDLEDYRDTATKTITSYKSEIKNLKRSIYLANTKCSSSMDLIRYEYISDVSSSKFPLTQEDYSVSFSLPDLKEANAKEMSSYFEKRYENAFTYHNHCILRLIRLTNNYEKDDLINFCQGQFNNILAVKSSVNKEDTILTSSDFSLILSIFENYKKVSSISPKLLDNNLKYSFLYGNNNLLNTLSYIGKDYLYIMNYIKKHFLENSCLKLDKSELTTEISRLYGNNISKNLYPTKEQLHKLEESRYRITDLKGMISLIEIHNNRPKILMLLSKQSIEFYNDYMTNANLTVEDLNNINKNISDTINSIEILKNCCAQTLTFTDAYKVEAIDNLLKGYNILLKHEVNVYMKLSLNNLGIGIEVPIYKKD